MSEDIKALLAKHGRPNGLAREAMKHIEALEAELGEARARVAAAYEEAAKVPELAESAAAKKHTQTSNPDYRAYATAAAVIGRRIKALTRPEETDALDRIRREERERVLDDVSDQWGLAIYGMTENGVRWLNEKAARELHPDIIAFGEWLSAIREDKT